MKNLTRVLLLFVILFSFQHVKSQSIAKIVDDVIVYTYSPSQILSAFNVKINQLGVFGMPMTFSDVEIIEHESNYYLVITDKDESMRATFAISIEQGEISSDLIVEGKLCCISFNCQELSLGCFPKEGACTECSEKAICMDISSVGSLIK